MIMANWKQILERRRLAASPVPKTRPAEDWPQLNALGIDTARLSRFNCLRLATTLRKHGPAALGAAIGGKVTLCALPAALRSGWGYGGAWGASEKEREMWFAEKY